MIPMTARPAIYADFQNADAQGRIRLNTAGTWSDLALQQLQLHEGLLVRLYADDADEHGQLDRLYVDGTVAWSIDEQIWVAAVNWSAVRHVSELLAAFPAPPAAPLGSVSQVTTNK
jgi:hypothetical protein